MHILHGHWQTCRQGLHDAVSRPRCTGRFGRCQPARSRSAALQHRCESLVHGDAAGGRSGQKHPQECAAPTHPCLTCTCCPLPQAHPRGRAQACADRAEVPSQVAPHVCSCAAKGRARGRPAVQERSGGAGDSVVGRWPIGQGGKHKRHQRVPVGRPGGGRGGPPRRRRRDGQAPGAESLTALVLLTHQCSRLRPEVSVHMVCVSSTC